MYINIQTIHMWMFTINQRKEQTSNHSNLNWFNFILFETKQFNLERMQITQYGRSRELYSFTSDLKWNEQINFEPIFHIIIFPPSTSYFGLVYHCLVGVLFLFCFAIFFYHFTYLWIIILFIAFTSCLLAKSIQSHFCVRLFL